MKEAKGIHEEMKEAKRILEEMAEAKRILEETINHRDDCQYRSVGYEDQARAGVSPVPFFLACWIIGILNYFVLRCYS